MLNNIFTIHICFSHQYQHINFFMVIILFSCPASMWNPTLHWNERTDTSAGLAWPADRHMDDLPWLILAWQSLLHIYTYWPWPEDLELGQSSLPRLTESIDLNWERKHNLQHAHCTRSMTGVCTVRYDMYEFSAINVLFLENAWNKFVNGTNFDTVFAS